MSSAPTIPRTRAKALVTVVLEIEVGSVWGEDCPTGQIYKQATEEALDAIRAGLKVNGIASGRTESKLLARVMGQPEVVSVITKKE